MSNRRHRATSKMAHESVKEHKSQMYEKIKDGMKRLKVGGTFEEIASASGLAPAQVWKRLSEMVDLGMCYNVGVTRRTSSGRSAMVRQLVGMKHYDVTDNPKTENEKKAQLIFKQLSLM